MSYSEKKRDYNLKYAREKMRRVPLDMQKFEYDRLKTAADAVHEPVNTFIKKSISLRIKLLSEGSPDPAPGSSGTSDTSASDRGP